MVCLVERVCLEPVFDHAGWAMSLWACITEVCEGFACLSSRRQLGEAQPTLWHHRHQCGVSGSHLLHVVPGEVCIRPAVEVFALSDLLETDGGQPDTEGTGSGDSLVQEAHTGVSMARALFCQAPGISLTTLWLYGSGRRLVLSF